MCNANGPSTPGLLDSLAVSVNRSIAFQHAKTLGRIQQKPCFRSSIPFRAGRYSLTFHPHYLSVYASTGDFGDTPYTQAATLDTGPVASSYPGGSHTRSSSNYFQSALATDGSPISGAYHCISPIVSIVTSAIKGSTPIKVRIRVTHVDRRRKSMIPIINTISETGKIKNRYKT